MALHQQFMLAETRSGRLVSNSFPTARPRLDTRLQLSADALTGMQPSLHVWRRGAPHQSRCRSAARQATQAVNMSRLDAVVQQPSFVNVSFKVEYKCAFGQRLTLVGNTAQMGHWSPKQGPRMQWSRGDIWTCNVMLPAGSTVECKYLIVDEQGREQRWQEGGNMVLNIPATCHGGLPVERYDVAVSWCQAHATYRALPLTTGAATAVAVAERLAEVTATVAAAAVATAAATAPAVSGAAAAADSPVMSWALSKGASSAAASRLNSAEIATQAAPGAAAETLPSSQPCAAANMPQKTLPQAVMVESKVATLVQAAASAVSDAASALVPAPAAEPATFVSTPAAAATGKVSSPALLPAFQMSAAAPGGDGEPATMSLVLPSRSRSPPVTLSLSSSFSKLMEMPALASRTPCAAGSSGAAAEKAAAGVRGRHRSSSRSRSRSSGRRSMSPVAPAAACASSASAPSSSSPAHRSAAAAAAATTSQAPAAVARAKIRARSQGHRRRQSARIVPETPMWGMEYDVYATAYGLPYMHTPFDLDAYAEYDHMAPEPTPSTSAAVASPSSTTHGSNSFMSDSQPACGTDPLESAVQAAHGTATSPAAAASAIAVDTIPIVGAATSTATVTAIGPAPVVPPATAPAASPAGAPDTSAFDAYRQVSRSSTSVSDWAGRTLFEMGSGRTLIDDDSDDENETADDEAALAQALAAPAAPADMAALLTQLGTALGRSVRLRYDGVDATAQDLLDLDRKIALAASKLYRQRDSLLSGWVRKEARRQLAAVPAAAPSGRAPMPGANTVTPV